MSSARGVMPAADSFSRSAGSRRRAAPHTSLRPARARAIGKAILPVAPVTRIFSESSIPSVLAHHHENVKYLIPCGGAAEVHGMGRGVAGSPKGCVGTLAPWEDRDVTVVLVHGNPE